MILLSPLSQEFVVGAALLAAAAVSLETLGTLRFWPSLFELGPAIWRSSLRIPSLAVVQLRPQDGETPRAVLRIVDGQTVLFRSRQWIGAFERGSVVLTGGEVIIEVRAFLSTVLLVVAATSLWLYLDPQAGWFPLLAGCIGLVGFVVGGRRRGEALALEVTKHLSGGRGAA